VLASVYAQGGVNTAMADESNRATAQSAATEERSSRVHPSYTDLLDAFGALTRPAAECVACLESRGLSKGQARNAVFRFRRANGLLVKRPASGALP